MKKDQKKLTRKDFDCMWGESGPYSQVRLCEETRILDDSVSRVFLVVEAEINPFTFEYVQKHRQRFAHDEPVLQLLEHAEYSDESGYVVSAGEIELRDEDSYQFARKRADMTIQTLIRMHAFVIKECGLGKNNKFGIIEDKTFGNKQFAWNGWEGRVEPIGDELWDSKTLVSSPTGIQNNKMRFFIIFAFVKNFDFKNESAVEFAKTLKKVSAHFEVEIEEAESFSEYVLITVLLPLDLTPASFIENVLDKCNMAMKKLIFQKDYFVTNVKRPTPEEIASFLQQLPL